MKLNKDQKRSLEQLKQHEGYKVLKLIEKTAKDELGAFLLKCDLSADKDIEIIKKNQLYMKAREDFLQNIDTHITAIYTPKI